MLFVSIGECMVEMAEAGDDRYRLGFAGDTLNTAWYARARLPADWQVEYYTALGTDEYSGRMTSFLNENGIGTPYVRSVPERRPGLYLIHQADGDRHFTYWRGQSAARLLADDPEHLAAAVDSADVIYFSGITMAILTPEARARLLSVVESARKSRGTKIAFDPNIRLPLWSSRQEARDAVMQAAPVADIVFPTWGDDADLFGDQSLEATATRYLDAGCSHVVVKNGAGDALAATNVRRVSKAPSQHVMSIDPTGAGDSFNGAYIAAILTGATLGEALREAHEVAGQVISQRGALIPQSDVHPTP